MKKLAVFFAQAGSCADCRNILSFLTEFIHLCHQPRMCLQIQSSGHTSGEYQHIIVEKAEEMAKAIVYR